MYKINYLNKGFIIKNILIILLLSAKVFASTDSHIIAAKDFLKTQGIEQASEKFWESQLNSSKLYYGKRVNNKIWDKISIKVNGKNAFLDEMAKSYAKYYSEKELIELTKMFNSKVMKKLMTPHEKRNQEFGKRAVYLGRELGFRITKYLEQNGHIK